MAKEPVEDTDPSTLSFNVVGSKFYTIGDDDFLFILSSPLLFPYIFFITLYFHEDPKPQNEIFPR